MSPPKKLNLQEHIISSAKKQFYVNQMFATIAPRYDLVTTLMSYGQDKRWKHKLVVMADVHPNHQMLDLACGTETLPSCWPGSSTSAEKPSAWISLPRWWNGHAARLCTNRAFILRPVTSPS